MIVKNYTVLTPLEFLSDVEQEARQAKKRFWAQAMECEGGETADRFFAALSESAKKGLDTRLHVDYYSLLLTDTVFNYLPTFSRKRSQEKTRRLKNKHKLYHDLQSVGVDVTLLNKPGLLNRLLPTFGRNHMKMVIIDDTVWIGGVNFHESNFHYADMMVRFTLPSMVEAISTLFLKIERGEAFHDYEEKIDESKTLLVDSGSKQSSIILDHAVELVTKAEKSIKMTTPFFPDGKMLTALSKRQREGVNVEVITPKMSIFIGYPKLINPVSRRIMFLTGRTIPIRYYPKIVHAKLLIVDDKEAIFGSHNFSGKGVRMQTGELALQTTNKHLVDNLIDFYNHL